MGLPSSNIDASMMRNNTRPEVSRINSAKSIFEKNVGPTPAKNSSLLKNLAERRSSSAMSSGYLNHEQAEYMASRGHRSASCLAFRPHYDGEEQNDDDDADNDESISSLVLNGEHDSSQPIAQPAATGKTRSSFSHLEHYRPPFNGHESTPMLYGPQATGGVQKGAGGGRRAKSSVTTTDATKAAAAATGSGSDNEDNEESISSLVLIGNGGISPPISPGTTGGAGRQQCQRRPFNGNESTPALYSGIGGLTAKPPAVPAPRAPRPNAAAGGATKRRCKSTVTPSAFDGNESSPALFGREEPLFAAYNNQKRNTSSKKLGGSNHSGSTTGSRSRGGKNKHKIQVEAAAASDAKKKEKKLAKKQKRAAAKLEAATKLQAAARAFLARKFFQNLDPAAIKAKQKRAKKRAKKQKKAACRIQALARRFLVRRKLQLIRLRKREADLRHKLECVQKKKEEEIRLVREEAEHQKDELAVQLARATKTNLEESNQKHGGICVEESQKLIAYLRKENQKVRAKNDKLRENCRNLRVNNARLEQTNASSQEFYAQLQNYHSRVTCDNTKLEKLDTTYRQKVEELQDSVDIRKVYGRSEHKVKTSYLVLIEEILEMVEASGNKPLLEEIREYSMLLEEVEEGCLPCPDGGDDEGVGKITPPKPVEPRISKNKKKVDSDSDDSDGDSSSEEEGSRQKTVRKAKEGMVIAKATKMTKTKKASKKSTKAPSKKRTKKKAARKSAKSISEKQSAPKRRSVVADDSDSDDESSDSDDSV